MVAEGMHKMKLPKIINEMSLWELRNSDEFIPFIVELVNRNQFLTKDSILYTIMPLTVTLW